MKSYKNIARNSGVRAYESGDDYIVIEFQDGAKYLYNYIRPGKRNVDTMKTLAYTGRGLSTFISVHVKKNYFKKMK